MTKRLRTWFYSACMFISFCGWSFAEIPPLPERKQATALIGWHEPPSCFKRDERSQQDCLYWLNQLGVAHLADKRYEHAIARFSQLLSLQEYAEVLSNRGVAYSHILKHKEAHKDFSRATFIAPHHHEPWANLAGVDLLFKRLPQAFANVSRALAIKPGDPEYLLLRAEILIALGKHKRAVADLRAAIDATRGMPGGTLYSAEVSERSADVH